MTSVISSLGFTNENKARARPAALLFGLAAWVTIGAMSSVLAADDGPRPIAWGREHCAECHMVLRVPRHAAQLQLADGASASFDDVGCMFRYVARRRPSVRAVWLRDSTSERWLRPSEAAFARSTQTPMRYGFAVVRRGTPGAVTEREARTAVLATSTPRIVR